MNKNALVIGLGWHTKAIITHLSDYFKAQGVPERGFASLWLTPIDDDKPTSPYPHHEQMALKLTQEALTDLNRDPHLRRWCAPNWLDWNENIIGTRLWGQFAIMTHYRALYNRIEDLLSQIARDDTPVNIYVIAHAHDPFASGAVIDLAYLIGEKMPRHFQFRTYGMLLLPDTEGDPLVIASDNDDDSATERAHLQQAISYALLRELQFQQSSPSFYSNYQSIHAIERIQDISPFQQGDCYLLGAKSDLTYSTILDHLARFCYLQTHTNIGREIPTSPLGSGKFSTFGTTHETNPVRQVLADGDRQLDALLQKVLARLLEEGAIRAPRSDDLVKLLNEPMQRDADVSNDTEPIDLSRMDGFSAYRDELERLRTEAVDLTATTLDQLDTIYADLRQRLSRIEREIARAVSNRLETLDQRVDNVIESLQQDANDYLRPLYKSYRDEYKLVAKKLEDVQVSLPALEQRANRVARQLQRVRMLYAYTTERRTGLMPRVVGVSFTGVGAAFLFVGSAFSGWEIVWILLAAVVLWFFLWRQRMREAEMHYTAYVNTIVDFLDIQRQMIVERAQYRYLTALRDTLYDKIAGSGARDVDNPPFALRPKIAILEALQTQLTVDARQQQQVADVNTSSARAGIYRTVLDVPIETALMDIDPHNITQMRDQITPHIDKLLRYGTPDQELLTNLMPRLHPRAEALLAFTRLSDDQARRHHLVGLENWADGVETALTSEGIRAVHLQQYATPADSNGATSEPAIASAVYLLQVVTGIAAEDLGNVADWRERYKFWVQRTHNPNDPNSYSHQAIFHPRRVGIAVPAITPETLAHVDDRTHLVMLIVLCLHWVAPSFVIDQLSARFNVQTDDTHFDELCGALQESPDTLQSIRRDAHIKFEREGARVIAQLQDLQDLIIRRMPFMESNYADWASWAAQVLLDDIQDRLQATGTIYSEGYLTTIAEVYYYYKRYRTRANIEQA